MAPKCDHYILLEHRSEGVKKAQKLRSCFSMVPSTCTSIFISSFANDKRDSGGISQLRALLMHSLPNLHINWSCIFDNDSTFILWQAYQNDFFCRKYILITSRY